MPFDALRQNLTRSHGFEPLDLEGQVPEDLRGTLFRVGPGVFERFGVEVAHPFEADGAITIEKMRLDEHGRPVPTGELEAAPPSKLPSGS